MIATFDVITEFGTGDPKMLSGGISTALITTELGLTVAIPMLLLGTMLKTQANRLLAELERGALTVANLADPPKKSGKTLAGASPQAEPNQVVAK